MKKPKVDYKAWNDKNNEFDNIIIGILLQVLLTYFIHSRLLHESEILLHEHFFTIINIIFCLNFISFQFFCFCFLFSITDKH